MYDNTATVMNKGNVLNTEVKVKVLQQTEKKKPSCQEFGLINSTVQMIWTKRNKIISATEQNGLRVKQFQKPE